MIVRLKNMGANTPVFDLEAGDLPLDVMSFANNYLLRDNKVLSFNGEKVLNSLSSIATSTVLKFYGGRLEYILSGAIKFYIVAGFNDNSTSDAVVLVFDGNTWYDISNALGYPSLILGDELLWTGCKLGPIQILNNPKHFPEYWSPASTSQRMQDLKFDPTHTWRELNFRAKVMRSHKNFLFAINLTEGGVEFPTSYRWSHPADINGLPFTWDETDLSAIAGKASVEGQGEALIDGLSLRDSFALYSSRAMNVLDFVGGEFVWQSRKLSHSHGVLTTNCVVEAVGNHFVLTDGDIVINDGNSITSLLSNKMKRFLERNLSDTAFNNCFAQASYINNEVWFFIVQPAHTYPSLAIIINYVTGAVSVRDIQGKKSSASFGQGLNPVLQWDNVSPDLTWDNINRVWAESDNSPFDDVVVGLDTGPTEINTPTFQSGVSLALLDVVPTPSFYDWSLTTGLSKTFVDICCSSTLPDSLSNPAPSPQRFVAVHAGGLMWKPVNTSASTFDWTETYTESGSTVWKCCCWSTYLGQFVALGGDPTAATNLVIATSTDGTSWTITNVNTNPNFFPSKIVWAENLSFFIAIGTMASAKGILRSTNGTTWVRTDTFTWSDLAQPSALCWSKYYGSVIIGDINGNVYINHGPLPGHTDVDSWDVIATGTHIIFKDAVCSEVGSGFLDYSFTPYVMLVGQPMTGFSNAIAYFYGPSAPIHFLTPPGTTFTPSTNLLAIGTVELFGLAIMGIHGGHIVVILVQSPLSAPAETAPHAVLTSTTTTLISPFSADISTAFVPNGLDKGIYYIADKALGFLNVTLPVISDIKTFISNLEINDEIASIPVQLNTFLQRTHFDLEGQDVVTTIVRVYPHIRSVGSVSIQFGSHSHLTSEIRWKAPVKYKPATMRQINVRTTGELHAWRITSIGVDPFEFTGMDIEYELAGKR